MNLDPNLLLATGAMSGPQRRTRPLNVTWRTRFSRWLRRLLESAR